ncbi:hypothetical protein EIP91_000677 [Steccherinum ochraceum]|uniref:RING-type domain-containing protein n=1 Tax=Steccherinum ochraceum TaxID=92696 RepID=A0A4V2MWP9_9APHY|nr:hypothetical protein EIP91_000677 [Steccherinum ochraceum]
MPAQHHETLHDTHVAHGTETADAGSSQDGTVAFTPVEGSHRTGDQLSNWSSSVPTNAPSVSHPPQSSLLPMSPPPAPDSSPSAPADSAARSRSTPAVSPALPGHRSVHVPSGDSLLLRDVHPSLSSQSLSEGSSVPDASPSPSSSSSLASTPASFYDTPHPAPASLSAPSLPTPAHIPLSSASSSAPHLPTTQPLMSDDTSQFIPDSAHINPDSTLTPDLLLPLLQCPLCDPPSLLSSPITLRCGHTICLEHLTDPPEESSFVSSFLSSIASTSKRKLPLPPCPIPTCRAVASGAGNATVEQLPRHPQSRVNYLPPPSAPLPPHLEVDSDEAPPPLRVDVTLNKILNLVVHSQPLFDADDASPTRPTRFPDDERDSDTESEEDGGGVEPTDPERDPDPDRSSLASVPDTPLPNQAIRRPRSRPRSLSPQRRPRKRRRRATPKDERRDSRSGGTRLTVSAKFEKELHAELLCMICYSLMWQPVTTPCQHTFCSKCLHRCLDHNNTCPVCRQQLPGYGYFQESSGSSTATETGACNKLVLAILLKAFPEAYASRGAAIEEEERQGRLDTPIFVCQLCYPGMPMFLNFYEPRYRLMLRRCLATPYPCFGAIPPPRTPPPTSAQLPSQQGGMPEFGTMLEIRNVQMLPDGQCRVETWGTWRFRILERGTLDGYGVARIERVDDVEEGEGLEVLPVPASDSDLDPGGSEDGPSPSPSLSTPPPMSRGSSASFTSESALRIAPTPYRTNEELMAVCHAFLDQLREGTPWVVQHIDNSYVPMPTDPAQFSFWMGLLLPIDEHEKPKLLPIRSPRLRLLLVVHWIEKLNSQWSHSYALASRSQVVLWWLRDLLIAVYFQFAYQPPRPFFILDDNYNPGRRVGLPGLRPGGGWGNVVVLAGYVVLVWSVVVAQRGLGGAEAEA